MGKGICEVGKTVYIGQEKKGHKRQHKFTSCFIFHSNRKKAVRAAAVKKWPGNSLPNFKKSPESLKELASLVEELTDDCSYAPVGFNNDQIRQHILDVLNERRRSIRNGHDYTKVD